ncbi:3283_t:CDS:2 [Paraglomus occultum]|uniref:3283_t:CDS:1 n=1 Tax=Paraglomus occultum TaxID=144539 RepID=A0A9N9G722_9GLOM|nr:3283_t:CDS:2 [Paraglomus occultum]
MTENVLSVCNTALKYVKVVQDIASVPILGQILLILETILTVVDNAEINKQICKLFKDRIIIAQNTLEKFEEEKLKHKLNPALENYKKVLKDIEKFVKKLTDKNGLRKYWAAINTNGAQELLTRFDQAVADFGLNTAADISKDVSIIADDIKQMQECITLGIITLDSKLDNTLEQIMGLQKVIKTGKVEQSVLESVWLDPVDIEQDPTSFDNSAKVSGSRKVIWKCQPAFQKRIDGFVNDIKRKEVEKDVAILTQLQACKNIITLYGVFKINQTLYLLMENAQYGSLHDYMQKNHSKMDWSLRYSIALGIVQGVCFMHKVGLLHHDLRAQNILLAEHFIPKITNFHYARSVTEVSRRIRNEDREKPRWAPPEKLSVQGFSFNQPADVYNVGYLLWEIASGKIPFADDNNIRSVMEKLMKGLRDPIPKDTPEKYAEVINKAWDQNPSSRPTITEIYVQLEAAYREFKNKAADIDKISGLVNQDGLLNLEDNTGLSIEDALKAHSSASYDVAYKIFQEIDIPKVHYYCGLCNLKAAAEHFRKAADGGNSDGQLRYGAALMKGDGLQRDVELGFDYLCKAAENGNSAAQFNVGEVYWSGRINEIGIDRDAGKRYLIMAAKAGHSHAKKLCNENDIDWE